ncbi:glycoside hydrolase clan GH-D [Beutenbergia cavernae DSM 12333]|uniref:alpha-galactosidase n=1 Tax=Beutenbergia cavernae (strain ATCC BAA-8 / DSM 12333 / CCUG 43141 / JCM 11478 / NBRC 16432 / NCIMB 13614 / HKI 0122) TaxID=471853 RepID=C5BZN2_BEUC1|nr:glycoside hydrolase clan GH-D [Beutenbergia cavernae DSM 12333]
MDRPAWRLRTASTTLELAAAPDELGPVLVDWYPDPASPGEARAVPGAEGHGVGGFATPADRLPLLYTALGTRHTRAAELAVDHGSGLVGARLRCTDVASASLPDGGDELRASFVDSTGHVAVELDVVTHPEHDVVELRSRVTNTGDAPLVLDRALTAALALPVGPGAVVDLLGGHWSREFSPFRVDLPAGELAIGSRQGITSHTYSPVVTVTSRDPSERGLRTEGRAQEDRDREHHRAYGVALAWSGSWRMVVDAAPFRPDVRVSGGAGDDATRILLEAGASFEAPPLLAVCGRTAEHVTAAWHDHARTVLARDLTPAHRPIVYNSWYATTFDVTPAHQLSLAEAAASLGVEVFVVDDGWFRGRDHDRAGLGDWTPDPHAFPDGLDPLVSGVTALGMRFGIWMEPEAVNPDSDLYREHPDWVYRAGDRPLVTLRHQYVLDLGRPEVESFVLDAVRAVLADERISYLKWDMNRPVSDGGRPGDPHGREWALQHTHAYYRILRAIRAEFPHVTVEACSGGGGRVDLAVLALTDVVWPSDETGPRDRLAIQHGFLSAYPPSVMSSWVTDAPDILDTDPASLELRFVVAMAGVLGVGSDLLAWDAATRERARELVALYADVRDVVHTGHVVRHGSPADDVYAVEYGPTAAGRPVVLLVYGRPGRAADVALPLATPDPGARYRVRSSGEVVSGADARAGLSVPFALADDADVVVLEPL